MKTCSKNFYFLGIDETSLNIGKGSSLVVVAETKNKKLTKNLDYLLEKSKDILQKAKHTQTTPIFPTLDEMRKEGLSNYYWMRCSGGRFSRQELQHAIIAHMIQINGYKPNNIQVQIDAFYGAQDEKSKYLICEYLRRKNFNLSEKNIEIVGQGDKRVPIINYADLLAFQIGLSLGSDNKKFIGFDIGVDSKYHQEVFDEKRVMSPLDGSGRDLFEDVMLWYKRDKNRSSKANV